MSHSVQFNSLPFPHLGRGLTSHGVLPVFIATFWFASIAWSQAIDPSSIDRAEAAVHKAVQSGDVAGAAHLVAHNGKIVHFQAAGVRDIEDQLPLTRDTIVRIYSMSKPIVSVAAMTLFERGEFQLEDPVAKFIPAFEKTTVLVSNGNTFEKEPGKRPITIRDVFRHTTGYAYGGQGNPEIESAHRREGLHYTTVELMFTDQLNGVGGGFRFGLGFAIADVDVGSGAATRKAKQYSWGGYASTDFRIVPEEKLFQIFIRQRIPSSHALAREVFSIVYQGLSTAAVEQASDAKPKRQIDSSVHWPGWMGPKRDGWVAKYQPPERWPAELEKVWQVEVGTGYGSPLVSGSRVFQHARQGENEVVWCLDLETGDVKWRGSCATPFKMGGGGERHGKGPKSSPMFADGKVFTMSITGVISAWDAASGDLVWRRDYGARFPKSHPYWGASTSPIVDDDRVIVHFGTDEEGLLVALDVESGKEIWTLGDDGPSYSSPLLAEFHGLRQVVEWNHRALLGVESETGRKLWEYSFPHIGTDQNMPTPAIHNGRVLLSGENRGIHSLEPVLEDGVWTVREVWHQDAVALNMSSAVINRDLLYGFSHYDSGRLFCLDPKTGDVLWQGPGRAGQNVMFLAIPDHIVALMNDGELKIIAADGDRFQPVASYRVASSETWAPPVVMQVGILVKDKQTLTLWSLGDRE